MVNSYLSCQLKVYKFSVLVEYGVALTLECFGHFNFIYFIPTHIWSIVWSHYCDFFFYFMCFSIEHSVMGFKFQILFIFFTIWFYLAFIQLVSFYLIQVYCIKALEIFMCLHMFYIYTTHYNKAISNRLWMSFICSV